MKKLFVALLTALAVSSAFAASADKCNTLSNFAYSVAIARDSNIEQNQLQTQVHTLVEEGKIHQFKVTDKTELGRIITILYSNPQATPQYAQETYFQHCLQTSVDVQ